MIYRHSGNAAICSRDSILTRPFHQNIIISMGCGYHYVFSVRVQHNRMKSKMNVINQHIVNKSIQSGPLNSHSYALRIFKQIGRCWRLGCGSAGRIVLYVILGID